MTKREQQLHQYIHDETNIINSNIIRDRIEFINEEIRNLDNERFYLLARLFSLQKEGLANDNGK